MSAITCTLKSRPTVIKVWEAYEEVRATHPYFAMRQIDGPADIYPVFRDLLGDAPHGCITINC